jgi:predicted small secreted protein
MKKKIYGVVLLAAVLGMLTTGCEAMKGAAPPPPPGAPARP